MYLLQRTTAPARLAVKSRPKTTRPTARVMAARGRGFSGKGRSEGGKGYVADTVDTTGEKEFEGEGGDFEEPSSTPTSTPQQPQEQRSGSGMAGGGRGEELTYEEIALYAAPEEIPEELWSWDEWGEEPNLPSVPKADYWSGDRDKADRSSTQPPRQV